MERPLCPLCNTKHFAREEHAFRGSIPEMVVKVSEGTPKIAVEAPMGKWKTREEYNAYMREYMRRYRARKV